MTNASRMTVQEALKMVDDQAHYNPHMIAPQRILAAEVRRLQGLVDRARPLLAILSRPTANQFDMGGWSKVADDTVALVAEIRRG
jgi:hypothetical protein